MELKYYIIRRLLLLIPTLLGLVLLVFLLMRMFPDTYLIARYINPKSGIPYSVQAEQARALHVVNLENSPEKLNWCCIGQLACESITDQKETKSQSLCDDVSRSEQD